MHIYTINHRHYRIPLWLAVGILVSCLIPLALQASVITGQGASVGIPRATELMWSQKETVFAAAPIEANPLGLLVFGMIAMITGLGIHALYQVSHAPERVKDRPVPVRVRSASARKKSKQKQVEVLWIQKTFRF